MRTCDVEDFKTRSDAVFGSMALDLLGQQIDSRSPSLSDVVSIVEMGDSALTSFEREPVTNVLYNKVLKRMRAAKPSSHGMYIPALDEAERLMAADCGNSGCALMMIFLSDGKPSDHLKMVSLPNLRRVSSSSCITVFNWLYPLLPPLTWKGGASCIEAKVDELAKRFGGQLMMGTIGFGGAEGDFNVLKVLDRRTPLP